MDPQTKENLDAVVAEGRARALTYLAGMTPASELFPLGRGSGADVYDEYGEVFLDFGIGSQLLFGHRDAAVAEMVLVQMQHHTWQGEYGQYQDRLVADFAQMISERFPPDDEGFPRQVFFTDSLREARIAAVALCTTSPDGPLIVDTLSADGSPYDAAQLQARAQSHGTQIVIDESATGWGRTGAFCWHEQHSLTPDAVVLGSAGTAGIPFAAVVAPRRLFTGATFATQCRFSPPRPSPLACAAGVALLPRLTPDLMRHVQNVSDVLHRELDSLRGQFGHVLAGSSGVGLVRTIRLAAPSRASEFRAFCRNAGLLIQPNLRLTPPLTVTEHQVRGAMDAIAAACIDMGEVP